LVMVSTVKFVRPPWKDTAPATSAPRREYMITPVPPKQSKIIKKENTL